MPHKRKSRYMLCGLLLATLCVALDQLSKWAILDVVRLPEVGRIVLLPFFNLTMVWNHGVSFGMFASTDPLNAYALSVMALIIVGWMVGWMWRTTDKWLVVAQSLIIGGALGNVIDRLRFGAVVDFLDFHVMGYHWPAFNVADAAIFVGVMLLLGESFLGVRKKGQAA